MVGNAERTTWERGKPSFCRSTHSAQGQPYRSAALVYRLANNDDVAGGQLAVFQGASEAPISESYGSSEQRGKTAKWPRPGGLR